jgi:hypothetical protein
MKVTSSHNAQNRRIVDDIDPTVIWEGNYDPVSTPYALVSCLGFLMA